MILFCDENIGTNVPTALRLVGYDARSLVKHGWMGTPDNVWLERVGKLGWLVLSCNKKMLTVPIERQAIIDNAVGLIILTTGEENLKRNLRLLLTKWKVLEKLDRTNRPFAYFLSPNGVIKGSYRGMKL